MQETQAENKETGKERKGVDYLESRPAWRVGWEKKDEVEMKREEAEDRYEAWARHSAVSRYRWEAAS